MTLSVLIVKYLDYLQYEKGSSSNTVRNRRYLLVRFQAFIAELSPHQEDVPLETISLPQLVVISKPPSLIYIYLFWQPETDKLCLKP